MGGKKTNVSRKLRVTVIGYKEQAPKLNIADDPWRLSTGEVEEFLDEPTIRQAAEERSKT
jgi:hypothetical protein